MTPIVCELRGEWCISSCASSAGASHNRVLNKGNRDGNDDAGHGLCALHPGFLLAKYTRDEGRKGVVMFLAGEVSLVEVGAFEGYKNAGLGIQMGEGTLERLGFISIQEVKETKLQKGNVRFEPRNPVIDTGKCTLCGLCQRICPYFALTVAENVIVNCDNCFGCGLCQTKCPSKAISGVL